jgi:hypothetical protein
MTSSQQARPRSQFGVRQTVGSLRQSPSVGAGSQPAPYPDLSAQGAGFQPTTPFHCANALARVLMPDRLAVLLP